MLIELSYTLGEHIPKWPTNPSEKYVVEQSTQSGDPCNANSVFHHIHNGTHVDAPRHFDPNGKTIDQLSIEDFYYTDPYVLKLSKQKGERITLEDIKSRQTEIENCDILFIYTGYCDLRAKDPDAYIDGFPSISPDAARYLREGFPKLKAIALDSISVDDAVTAGAEGFPTHHSLLETNAARSQRTLLLYEDVNVSRILDVENIQAVCAFPVRWEGLEGAPVSMVAIV